MIRFRKGRIPIVPMMESLALHGAKAKAVKRPWPACLPRKGFPRSVIQRKTLYPAGAEFPLVTLQKSAGEAVGEERSYTTNSEPTRRRRTEMELCKEMYKPRQLLNSKDSAFLSCPTHPKYLGNFPGVGAAESFLCAYDGIVNYSVYAQGAGHPRDFPPAVKVHMRVASSYANLCRIGIFGQVAQGLE